MPNLFLIPVPIADDALHTIPPYVQVQIRQLDFFIAEHAKTARHFLKTVGLERPIQEITVVGMDKRDPKVAEEGFREAVKAGRDIGLMSEAGCPGVADPGAAIVALAHRMQVPVRPLVGPSSLLLALMASGMNGQRFVFHGYLPPNRTELAKALKGLEQQSDRLDQTQLFIETPYRSQMVLEVALETLSPETWFAVAQDLTGAGETVRSQPVRDWKKSALPALEKVPAVFLLYRGRG
jgi:16S rRNA (cytidine1402-2'-O)-methyltransferase